MSARVVVTGAAGFIGSHTARALLDDGWDVVGVDAFTDYYPASEKRANAATLCRRTGFRLVDGDLVDLPLVELLSGASAVVHLAAQPGVTSSWGLTFSTYVHHNILATQRLLEACAQAGVRQLVVASSSSVYGDAPAYPCSEDVAPNPVSPYGVTKLAMEHLCRAYSQPDVSDLRTTILRLFTVYGPGQRPDMALRRFLEAALNGRVVTVFGDGEQTRDFTYISDAVHAIVRSLEVPLRGEVLNVGGGRRTRVNEVLELVGQITGAPVEIVRLPRRPGDAVDTGADCRRAAQLIGYRPRVDLRSGLAEQAAWLAGRREHSAT
jgi:nucleoside-diphosphate-sugar epimerase